MAVVRAALCKQAAKLELEASKAIRLDPTIISALEALLLDVYTILRPGPCDYEQRGLLVQAFNAMAKDIFGSNNGFPVVEEFGSFVMDIFTARSDLDLSVNFSNDYTTELPRDKKIKVLRKFANFLFHLQRKGQASGVSPILRARVPVVKVVDAGTGIECDISAENKDGISRSSILTAVSSIDDRFRILSHLMKAWAKAHDINSSKDRTMNSLSIITLVAFHLQTRRPPILPPFSALLKDGTDVSNIRKVIVGFEHFGVNNKESVAELFVSMLSKLSSVECLWQHGLCASTFEGSWIYKEWESKIGIMSVEDFLDRSQNFARAVGKAEMQKIYKCINSSTNYLTRFLTGQIDAAKLQACLFGPITLNDRKDHPINIIGTSRKRSSSVDEYAPIKKARFTESAKELCHDDYETPTNLANPSMPLHPPTFPFQSGHGIHLEPANTFRSLYGLQHHLLPPITPDSASEPYHRKYLDVPLQSGYGPEHCPQLPIAPNFGFVPEYYPQTPIPSFLDYEPRSHPQLPITPQLGYVAEHQPRTPYQFSYGSNQRQQDGNSIPHRTWDYMHQDLLSGYPNQELGHPMPFLRPHQAYGPGYL